MVRDRNDSQSGEGQVSLATLSCIVEHELDRLLIDGCCSSHVIFNTRIVSDNVIWWKATLYPYLEGAHGTMLLSQIVILDRPMDAKVGADAVNRTCKRSHTERRGQH